MTRTRRAVLAACGAGLPALTGCSSLDTDRTTPSYDLARFQTLAQRDVPRPPATFPVSVPDAMVASHRDRARALVERVPEQLDIPNGDVRERLREDRTAVLHRLDATGDDATGRSQRPLERLATARNLREDAAAVAAAYRAATNDITQGAVADRREQLRSASVAFEHDWTYRGDDPTTAVVVHRTLEELLLEARPAITPDRAFPDDPTTDVFRVGDLVRHIERGDAALSDAETLRTRYREALSESRPYRTTISVAAERLRRTTERYREELHFSIDPDSEELPFDRSIEGTPLEWLYFRAVDGIFRADAQEARHRGDPATVVIATAIELTVLRALDAVVADIENNRVTVPETVDGIAAARQEAIDSLEDAWATSPTALATEVAHWSQRLVYDVPDRLSGPAYETDETPDMRDAYQVWAIYVTAAEVAAAVPRTVADVEAALRSATE